MKNLYIVGAGGFGREVLNLVLDIHAVAGPRWNIMGFLDDTEAPLQGKACDFSVVGSIVDYSPRPHDVLALAIGNPADKRKLAAMLKARGATFETLIYPYANLGRNNTLGEGCIVCGGTGMTVNITIGNFVTLLACGLGHDVRIGSYSTISPSSHLMGGVTLGEGVFLGANSVIAPRLHIGNNAYVCLGSVVMKDVGEGRKVMGNPAREIG